MIKVKGTNKTIKDREFLVEVDKNRESERCKNVCFAAMGLSLIARLIYEQGLTSLFGCKVDIFVKLNKINLSIGIQRQNQFTKQSEKSEI